jgi:hypothetical protein
MIHQRYRRDYDGEFILADIDQVSGVILQKREWVDNPIDNQHISGRAAVIAQGFRYSGLTHQKLSRHRGGLLGTKRLQTYGTGSTWQDMRFDFFITNEDSSINQMLSSGYTISTTVYTSIKNCLRYPGNFYPVPYQPVLDYLAQSVYLAAFDGHTEVFLLGYNKDTLAGTYQWKKDIDLVMKTYDSTRFWLVGSQNFPLEWCQNSNVGVMDYRRFITYCDI